MFNIDKYWAAFFGVEPKALGVPGISVVPHKMLSGYNGAWLFQRGSTLIVSVPEIDIDTTRLAATRVLDPDHPPAPKAAYDLFGARVERVIGPAYQGYVTASHFQPAFRPDVHRLTDVERPSLRAFAAELDSQEWEHSSIDAGDEHIFIAVKGAEIIAAANATERDGATFIGVATHPRYRGQGNGKAVVSAAVSFALTQQRTVRFQTLVTNLGSIGIARGLGFQDYARTIAVRFIK